jgi:hypothetical protein
VVGSVLNVPVALETAGHAIAGVQTSIGFSAQAPIRAAPGGRPDCVVSANIDKTATAFSFFPSGCIVGQSCTGIHAVVLSLSNVSTIANDSTLFTCSIEIPAGAAAGSYPLTGSGTGASSPDAASVPVGAIGGAVQVIAPTSTPSATTTPTHPPTATLSGSPTNTATLPLPTATASQSPASTPSVSPVSTESVLPTSSPTNTPSPPMLMESPTPTIVPRCVGDCSGDGVVTIDELIVIVNIALVPSGGAQPCTNGDPDGSGEITIGEIVAAVSRALNGCE